MFFKDKRQTPEASEAEIRRIWFKVVYVFDISQTDSVTPAMLLEAVETIATTVKTILSGCQEPAQLCAA